MPKIAIGITAFVLDGGIPLFDLGFSPLSTLASFFIYFDKAG